MGEKTKKNLRHILAMLIIIALSVLFVVLIWYIFNMLLLPKDYLFYEHGFWIYEVFRNLLCFAVTLAFYNLFLAFSRKTKFKIDDFLKMGFSKKDFKKRDLTWILIFVFIFYLGFANFTYVTEDKIVKVSPFNLSGKEYSYSEVEKIETGFGDKVFSFNEYEENGNFYYKITLDGKETVFHTPTVNSKVERYEDSYLELEEFDNALVSYGVEKKSSGEGYEACDYEQRYVDRFLRIIGNK